MSKTPVLLAARKGKDVFRDDIRFRNVDSSKNQFKIDELTSGTISFDAGSGGTIAQLKYVDIEHNLGYQPTFVGWAGSSSVDWQQNPVANAGSTGPTKWCTGISRIDDDTIRFYFYIYDFTLANYSAFDVNYKYIIYVDPNKNAWS